MCSSENGRSLMLNKNKTSKKNNKKKTIKKKCTLKE